MNITRRPITSKTHTHVVLDEPIRFTRRKSWKEDETVLVESLAITWQWEKGEWTTGSWGGIIAVSRRLKKDGSPFANTTSDHLSIAQIRDTPLAEIVIACIPSEHITISPNQEGTPS